MNSFRDLIAWQKAVDLIEDVYSVVRDMPRSEAAVLGLQMRRAALAIPSDIAEGRGRHTVGDYRHFLREARGSAQELESDIEVAIRLSLITPERGAKLIGRTQEVGRLISGLLRSLPNT